MNIDKLIKQLKDFNEELDDTIEQVEEEQKLLKETSNKQLLKANTRLDRQITKSE